MRRWLVAYDLVLQAVEELRQKLDHPEQLLSLMEIWDDLQGCRDDEARDLVKIERALQRKAVLS